MILLLQGWEDIWCSSVKISPKCSSNLSSLFWSGHGHTGLGQQCHSKSLTQHAQGPLAPQEQQKANSLQGHRYSTGCILLDSRTRHPCRCDYGAGLKLLLLAGLFYTTAVRVVLWLQSLVTWKGFNALGHPLVPYDEPQQRAQQCFQGGKNRYSSDHGLSLVSVRA